MPEAQRFSFHQRELPYLPLRLTYQSTSLDLEALLDTGSTVNVLPYELGLQLGAIWEQHTAALQLAGNLSNVEARGILLTAILGEFPPVRLAFAWARSSNVPVILGHVNFFLEFDVCFYRADACFEVRRRQEA